MALLLTTIFFVFVVLSLVFSVRWLRKSVILTEFASRVFLWIALAVSGVIYLFKVLTLIPQTEEPIRNTYSSFLKYYEQLYTFLNIRLFGIGDKSTVTLLSLLNLIFLIWAVFFLGGIIRRILRRKILANTKLDFGVQHAVSTVSSYVFVFIGIIIVIQTSGLDFGAITVIAGAVGVGVGFGLQGIANNFISGLIILIERPIKVGDRIEVNEIDGNVDKIGARATTVITNDNIAYIVPNSEFISGNVINWSYTDRKVRFRIPVEVSYKCNPRFIEKILLEVAKENENVLRYPIPRVFFDGFGSNGMKFRLGVWTSKMMEKRPAFMSELYFKIWDKFKEHDIQVPYPQHDLHFKSGVIPHRKATSDDENNDNPLWDTHGNEND
ncbi:MAG: small-conductance mechanosensitive channel [Sphingobacteriales bacterium]|jgi:small-conductance mechanosensitive channel